jgi:predicted RNA-binding protein with PIN domain
VDQAAGGTTVDGAGDGAAEVVLPEPVRQRVLALAADALGRLPAVEVPPPLRPAARFTPAKRVRLAATALAAVLEADTAFRLRAAEQAEIQAKSIVDAVRTGTVPAAADPVELAAAAYLLRPQGWPRFVERAREALDEASSRDLRARHDAQLDRLQRELEVAKSAARTEAERVRESAEAARAEVETLRRQLREQIGLRRAAERARGAAEEALTEERRHAATAESAAAAELRRLRQRLTDAEDAVELGRRVARESRQADEARLWLLLDTLGGAVQGLRRELALTPSDERPADAVAADGPRPDSPVVRGDDPELLDRLLELPRVHLVVDGYNVTKSGYGELPLATQRSRLIRGLGALAARTGAEVSCVFDGAVRPPAMPPAPRGLRVLFSPPGEPADDLIRRLVSAEPPGRPVVVVSSDREVAEDVQRAGAYPVDSVLLLRRLDRG